MLEGSAHFRSKLVLGSGQSGPLCWKPDLSRLAWHLDLGGDPEDGPPFAYL